MAESTQVIVTDAYLNGLVPSGNYGTDPVLYAGGVASSKGGVTWYRRSVLVCSLPAVPAGHSFVSAALQLYNRGDYGGGSLNVSRVTEDWEETFVSWLMRTSLVSWTQPGGDLGLPEVTFVAGAGAGWENVDVTSIVADCIAQARDFNVCLHEGFLGLDEDRRQAFHSGEGPASYRPRLVLTSEPEVIGPYRTEATDVLVPGSRAGSVATAGARAAAVHVPAAVAGGVN